MTQPYPDLSRIFSNPNRRSLDRRGRPRLLSISRFVKIEHDGKELLARCRNISDSGTKIDTPITLAAGEHVAVVFSPRDVVAGTVVWSNGSEHGIAFDELIDCVQILSGLGLLSDPNLAREHA